MFNRRLRVLVLTFTPSGGAARMEAAIAAFKPLGAATTGRSRLIQ